MKSDLYCRPMSAADCDAIAAWMLTISLWQRYGITLEGSRASFQSGLAQGDLMLVALAEGGSTPVGFTWTMPRGAFGRSPYLRLLGVHPDFSGQGVGSLLLRQVEQALLQAGHTIQTLLVSDFNSAAQRFYQRHGYQQIGVLPAFVLPDIDELIFWKRLADVV